VVLLFFSFVYLLFYLLASGMPNSYGHLFVFCIKGSGRRTFSSRKGVHDPIPANPAPASQHDSRAGNDFRSRGFNSAKSSYGRGIESPTLRHSGLVADEASYPSNDRYPGNSLYGDAFYPASDDYYYAGGLAGHSAGYDPQAPVDYDYYNVAPGY